MPNRYCRDELLNIALDAAHLPNIDARDRPDGVILPHAHCIQWLQDIVDWWYEIVPFSTTVTTTTLNLTANTSFVALPIDFIVDVRNGYTVEAIPGDSLSYVRRVRLPFQKFLNRYLANQKATNIKLPDFYCVRGKLNARQKLLNVTPTPTQNVNGILWYYQLPERLNAGDYPEVASDKIIIEYVRIRACEQMHIYDPGTAEKYCERLLGMIKAAGLLNEPEDDEIPLDNQAMRNGVYGNIYNWMGAV